MNLKIFSLLVLSSLISCKVIEDKKPEEVPAQVVDGKSPQCGPDGCDRHDSHHHHHRHHDDCNLCPKHISSNAVEMILQTLCKATQDQNLPLIQSAITEDATMHAIVFNEERGRCADYGPMPYVESIVPFMARGGRCNSDDVVNIKQRKDGTVIVNHKCESTSGSLCCVSHFKPCPEDSCVYKLAKTRCTEEQCKRLYDDKKKGPKH